MLVVIVLLESCVVVTKYAWTTDIVIVVVTPELYFDVSVGVKVAVIKEVPTLPGVTVEFPESLSATTEVSEDV